MSTRPPINNVYNGTTWGAVGGGGGAWSDLTVPTANLSLAMGAYTTTFGWTSTGDLDAWTNNFNNNSTSSTTQNAVVINNAAVGSFTDTATENLLLLQQLDTTTACTTVLTNALKIDSAASSGITNGITLTNSAGNITNGINLVDSAGGTFTTGLNFSGTFTNEISLRNAETIDNALDGTVNIGAAILKLTGGTSIVSDQITVALLNTTTTTLQLGGAAVALNIGPAGSGASSIVLSGGSADTGCTLDGSTGNLTCSGDLAVNGGDITTASAVFNFDVANAGTINFRDGTNTLAAVSDQGTTGRLAVSGSLQAGSLTTAAYSRFGTAATGHGFTTADDVLIESDLEVDGVLYLDGRTISNPDGTATVIFATAPADINNFNILDNGSWLVNNNVNNGIAALMVNNSKAGDLFICFNTPNIQLQIQELHSAIGS